MRVEIVKLNGFWYLLDTKNNALIAVRNKGKLQGVRSKTRRMAEFKRGEWEERFKLSESKENLHFFHLVCKFANFM